MDNVGSGRGRAFLSIDQPRIPFTPCVTLVVAFMGDRPDRAKRGFWRRHLGGIWMIEPEWDEIGP